MLRDQITELLRSALHMEDAEVAPSPRQELGHYSTNAAMRAAKAEGKNPFVLAQGFARTIEKHAPPGFFQKVEAMPPGFVNMWLAPEILQAEFSRILKTDRAGARTRPGEKVMVEYTDPNPFKQFHIGHLMTNMIGEALARLFEANGAKVIRVNYQGDVGVHVAASIWGMREMQSELPRRSSLADKVRFLGRAYAAGIKAYREIPAAKADIDLLNKKIYERSDPAVNRMYDLGRRWSLDYFETIYARLGTKFQHYFFESEIGPEGAGIVRSHPEVFAESQGAIIFPGKKYGLHDRVFINSLGLPTYEAKELGLNKRKFELYHPDLSLVVTGNEINEYFQVMMSAMGAVLPEVAARTRHLGHGMLRLPTGKMSSRTGEVITAEVLIEEVKRAVAEKIKDRNFSRKYGERVKEAVALAAIRYSILRQGIGKDIVFDINTSIAFQGDSGPYLQYTYARFRSILRKAGVFWRGKTELLTEQDELRLVRKVIQFPEVIADAAENYAPNLLTSYLTELSNMSNRFYEATPILRDKDRARRNAHLLLIRGVAKVLKEGSELLGVEVLEKI